MQLKNSKLNYMLSKITKQTCSYINILMCHLLKNYTSRTHSCNYFPTSCFHNEIASMRPSESITQYRNLELGASSCWQYSILETPSAAPACIIITKRLKIEQRTKSHIGKVHKYTEVHKNKTNKQMNEIHKFTKVHICTQNLFTYGNDLSGSPSYQTMLVRAVLRILAFVFLWFFKCQTPN